MKQLVFDPGYFFKYIIQPAFPDLAPDFSGVFRGMLREFMVMDNVSMGIGSPIIDAWRRGNILQRKGSTCKTNWLTLATTTNRKIYVQEVYAAVEDCQTTFYQGAWQDFMDQSKVFRDFVTKWFREAIALDIMSNAYFGDVTREDDPNGVWNWNKYDGIVTKIANYHGNDNGGKLGPVVTDALPSGVMTPQEAADALEMMFAQRTSLMKAMAMDLSFTIDYDWATAYQQYLINTSQGSNNAPDYIQNGIPVMSYKGIPIYVNRAWGPILQALNLVGGVETQAHMGTLTLDNNFVWGTNKKYGGGPNMDQAYRVWYSNDFDVWRNKADFVAGTEIVSPQNLVFSITNLPTLS